MNTEIHLCTLFDSKFMTQGLALLESVSQNTTVPIKWTILAMDKLAYQTMLNRADPQIHLISIDDFSDIELQNVRKQRPWKEFCWTSAACLLKFCIDHSYSGQKIAYVDADCFFFSDIATMLERLDSFHSIGIHEHRFSEDRIGWLSKSGRFNVGVVAGVKGENFDKCVTRWRNQVIDRCDVNPSEGRCGDQTYLNEWPDLYDSLVIFGDPGVGLAPWNIHRYKVKQSTTGILIDDSPLYFFHFHGLELGFISSRVACFIPASGYKPPKNEHLVIYRSYVQALMREISNSKVKPRSSYSHSWLLRSLLHRRLIYTFRRSNY